MFSEQRMLWHFESPSLIRSCRKLLSTAQTLFIASLLLNSLSKGKIVAVDKTATFTSVLNTSTVQEPLSFLSIGNDVDLQNMTRVYLDAHVAGYVSKDLPLNIAWPFAMASKVWEYAKETYGSFGHDPHIYVTLCSYTTTQYSELIPNNYATRFDASYLKNIVKLEQPKNNAWTNVVNQTNEMLNFAFMVAHIVELSSGDTSGSPSYSTYSSSDRSSAWSLIFVYDVFLELKMKREAHLLLASDPSSPLLRNDQDIKESLDEDDRVTWIKNWFWPIYSKFEGAKAIKQFFKNCYSYFPRELENKTNAEGGLYYYYAKFMNKGEFVHFWSGSVGTDLRSLANFAFTWDLNDETNFQNARKLFLMLNYRCSDNNCEKLPVLDQLVIGFQHNSPSNLKTDETKPAITVISEQGLGILHDDIIRKRVKATLYRPLNQSEQYLYDGKNELYIFKTPSLFCYYITCSAPYMIKWVTNIPFMKEVEPYQKCTTGEYFNSRRLQDLPHIDKALQEKGQKTLRTTYTIQLVTYGVSDGILSHSNMGLLKCESIQNLTQATHIYLTDNRLDLDKYQYLPSDEVVKLVSDLDLNKQMIVPCKRPSLKMMPDLKIVLKTSHYKLESRTIWDKENKNIPAKLAGYNVIYDPVIGFTFLYEILPFKRKANATETLDFTCYLNQKPKERYTVHVRSAEQEFASKLTIVDDESEITSTASGCFLVKNIDRFLSVKILVLKDFPLKLIRCNTPDACNLFRQCLDSKSAYCYSDERRLQAEYSEIKNPHGQGLFRCLEGPQEFGYKPVYEYTFVGLNRIRYVLSENIPKEAIIHLDETHSTLFTNVPANFRCQIATFVLVPNIRFAVVYSNKTIVPLTQITDRPQSKSMPFLSFNVGVYDIDDVSSVINANSDQGIGWKNIILNLTSDVVKVMCFAPLHNSTEWVNATRSFVAKDIEIPKIKKDGKISRRVFEKDEQHFYLSCESSGAPDPEIKWILPDTLPAFEDKLEIDYSYLKFPQMKELFAGKYTCVASNLYGNDSYEFMLEYRESRLGWQEKTGIGFAVAFFMILSGVIVFLLLKYQNKSNRLSLMSRALENN